MADSCVVTSGGTYVITSVLAGFDPVNAERCIHTVVGDDALRRCAAQHYKELHKKIRIRRAEMPSEVFFPSFDAWKLLEPQKLITDLLHIGSSLVYYEEMDITIWASVVFVDPKGAVSTFVETVESTRSKWKLMHSTMYELATAHERATMVPWRGVQHYMPLFLKAQAHLKRSD